MNLNKIIQCKSFIEDRMFTSPNGFGLVYLITVLNPYVVCMIVFDKSGKVNMKDVHPNLATRAKLEAEITVTESWLSLHITTKCNDPDTNSSGLTETI